MDTSTLIQVVLMGVLIAITGIYAWRTHVISKAAKEQAEATRDLVEMTKQEAEDIRARASKEYVKELITTVIYPLLKRCAEIKKKLDTNYFAQDYKTGWPQVYGLPPELGDEEAKVLLIGTLEEGRQVFSFPEPSLGILVHRFYSGFDTNVWFRMPSFEEEHKNIADYVKEFDSSQPQLDKLLRFLAVEVKKLVAPYVNSTMGKGLFLAYSEMEKGRFISYVVEICFNSLLMIRDFSVFFKEFEREEAKKFWEENKENLLSLLDKEHVQEQVAKVQDFSKQLSGELIQIEQSLEALVEKYRSKCYITIAELPPFLSS